MNNFTAAYIRTAGYLDFCLQNKLDSDLASSKLAYDAYQKIGWVVIRLKKDKRGRKGHVAAKEADGYIVYDGEPCDRGFYEPSQVVEYGPANKLSSWKKLWDYEKWYMYNSFRPPRSLICIGKPMIRYEMPGKKDDYDYADLTQKAFQELVMNPEVRYISIEESIRSWGSYADRFAGWAAEPTGEYVTVVIRNEKD